MKKNILQCILALAIFLLASSQNSLPQNREGELLEEHHIQVLLKQLEQLEHQRQVQEVENLEIKKIYSDSERKERVKNYKALISKKANHDPKVAIIGQCASDSSSTGFDGEILGDLLGFIKEDQPKALFLAGNLIYGLDTKKENIQEKQIYINVPPKKNIFNESIEKLTGYYSSSDFKENLDKFIRTLKQHLGGDIPIYPVLGALDAVGPDTAEIFRQAFGLKNAQILPSNQLVYTVSIGNALFIMLSTDYFDKTSEQLILASLSEEAKQWLKETLETQAANYDFVFIVASDAVFSTSAGFKIYQGLDHDLANRDKFWDLLMKFQVRAYFCGGEVLYGRTYRKGGWQIITGGGGTSSNYSQEAENTFYHFLTVSLPKDPSKNPTVSVFNRYGINRDEFFLSKTPPLIYDLRISHRN